MKTDAEIEIVGYLKVPWNFPTFVVPVFRDLGGFAVQTIAADGFVNGFETVPSSEVTLILPDGIVLGAPDERCFGFALSPEQAWFGTKADLAPRAGEYVRMLKEPTITAAHLAAFTEQTGLRRVHEAAFAAHVLKRHPGLRELWLNAPDPVEAEVPTPVKREATFSTHSTARRIRSAGGEEILSIPPVAIDTCESEQSIVTDRRMISPVNAKDRPFPLEWTRNIGIAAHIDAGKTTTTERILFYTGAVHKMGEVHEGTTVTDWMEQERERGITITAAAISCAWNASWGPWKGIKQRINIIDTPGHVDFTAEVVRSLRVLDGAVTVFCAVAGVQPQSESVWNQVNKHRIPRVAFINKMDRTGADFFRAVSEMREKLQANAHPIFLPIGQEENFSGLVDLVQNVAYSFEENPKDQLGMNPKTMPIPAEMAAQANEYRGKLIEAVCDYDDVIAEKHLNGDQITGQELMLGVRKATISLQFTGVIPGSAFKKKGIQRLLDCVVNYLPSPIDIPPAQGQDRNGNIVEVAVDDKAKLAALAFKLWSDPFVGRLVFLRIYAGQLPRGKFLHNPRTGRSERVSRLVLMRAIEREEIEVAYAGDICAVVGVKDVITGDTLCDEDFDIRLEPPSFPAPVISMSIEPISKGDQEKLGVALQRLVAEDPTLRATTDPDTGQIILAGMGELHLEIVLDRMKREYKVEVTAGNPQVAYRESITKAATGEGKFIRQSGGRGQYGHVVVRIEPNVNGKGVEVINKIVGGSIPGEYITAVREGIMEGTTCGTVMGYPVSDVSVSIVDGSYHEVDSTEMAFKMAGIFAFKDAMQKAGPILLEPIMAVEVLTPEEYLGDLMGDINRRRGQIQGMENKAGGCIISAHIPLVSLFGYSLDIRSMSRGRASASITPSHFKQAHDLTKLLAAKRSRSSALT